MSEDPIKDGLVAILTKEDRDWTFEDLFSQLVSLYAVSGRLCLSDNYMMRLRAYEKLKTLVTRGHVCKTGKRYKAIAFSTASERLEFRGVDLGTAMEVEREAKMDLENAVKLATEKAIAKWQERWPSGVLPYVTVKTTPAASYGGQSREIQARVEVQLLAPEKRRKLPPTTSKIADT